jgi:hypothetical protein
MKKRSILIKFVTVTVLTLSLAGQCFAAGNPFTDINAVAEKDKIVSLQERGIVKGTESGLFAPDSSVTAAQGIQLIVNAFGLNIDNIRFIKEPKATDYFSKANNSAWYANALIIASLNDMGLPADLDPNAKWTKEEFTYYLVKVMEKQGNLPMIKLVPAEIKDGDQMNALYSGAVQRALHYNLTALNADGKFLPKEVITRSEAAIQVYNALEYLKAHPAPTV